VGFTSPVFFLPLALGLFALAALVVIEYRKDDPLLPVKALSTQLPVTGTVVAMIAGAVFIAVLQLVQLWWRCGVRGVPGWRVVARTR